MEEQAPRKTPEYLLRAHRAYSKRRYASDPEFRQRLKERHEARMTRIRADPAALQAHLERQQQQARERRRESKLAAVADLLTSEGVQDALEGLIDDPESAVQGARDLLAQEIPVECPSERATTLADVLLVGEHRLGAGAVAAAALVRVMYGASHQVSSREDRLVEAFATSRQALARGMSVIDASIVPPNTRASSSVSPAEQKGVDVGPRGERARTW